MKKEGRVEITNAMFDKISINSLEIARLIGYVEALERGEEKEEKKEVKRL